MSLKLLKFGAEWCAPCKKQKEEFSNNPIDIEIQEIDIDNATPDELELMDKYKIKSIPTMLIINSIGEVKEKFCGFTTSSKITDVINKLQKVNNERFVVIEDFNDYIYLITDTESGNTKIFSTYQEAEKEAIKCQNGKVIKL